MNRFLKSLILSATILTVVSAHALQPSTASPPGQTHASIEASQFQPMLADVAPVTSSPDDSTGGVGTSNDPVGAGAEDAVAEVASSFIVGFAVKYPWLVTVFTVIGILRVLFKPIMSVIEKAVANDPTKLAHLQSFEGGPVFKAIAWVLDFGASIKLKPAISNTVAKA